MNASNVLPIPGSWVQTVLAGLEAQTSLPVCLADQRGSLFFTSPDGAPHRTGCQADFHCRLLAAADGAGTQMCERGLMHVVCPVAIPAAPPVCLISGPFTGPDRSADVCDVGDSLPSFSPSQRAAMVQTYQDTARMLARMSVPASAVPDDTTGLLRLLTENEFVGTFVQTQDAIVFCSRRFRRIFGFDDLQQLPASLADCVAESDRRALQHTLDACRRGDQQRFVCVCRRDAQTLKIYGARGVYEGLPVVVGTVVDMTDRMQMEQQLRSATFALTQMQYLAGIGYWEFDSRTRRQTWSSGIYNIFGLSPDEADVDRTRLEQMIHPDDLPRIYASYEQAMRTRTPYEVTYRITRPDGQLRYLHAVCLHDQGAGDEAVRTLGILRDVTDEKAAEQARHQAERDRAVVLECASESFMYLDPELRVRWANRMAVTDDDVTGQHCYAVRFGRSAPCPQCPALKSMRDGKVHFYEGRTPAGAYWQSHTSPVFDEHGAMTGVVECVTDITEKKMLEAERVQAEKLRALGELAGGIAHDFNNQLIGITGYARLLRQNPDSSDRQRYLDRILTASQRSVDLVQKLLAFSRRSAGYREPVDIHALVREVVYLLARSIDKRIEVQQDLTAADSVIYGDASQLQSAILNLGLNARDAMPEGGVLRFATRNLVLQRTDCSGSLADLEPGRYVCLQVEDSGMGMDADVCSRIFEPFFTTKPPGEGTGMGLPAVYGTVQLCQGAISVESTPGIGTMISLYLPIRSGDVPAETAAAEEALPQAPAGARAHVLVIDDEEIVREVVRDMLTEAGYQVTVSADGPDALERFARDPQVFDVVLLDMIMPRMSGADVLREMQQIDPQVQVMMLTGYSLEQDTQGVLTAGAVGWVHKSVADTELCRRVAEIVARKRERTQ